ncbi:MAG: AAA family ATPase [Pseudomonadota bacterium]
MIQTIAVANYRSLLDVKVPLGQLNLITGYNGSGKSNLYRALRLLAACARDGVVNALASEGGLQSTFWAGPETLSRAMKRGDVPVEGGPRKKPVRLKLGFSTDEFSYLIELGLPEPSSSAFSLDPEIKREVIWTGTVCRPASTLVERKGPVVRIRNGRKWEVASQHINTFDSIFSELSDPTTAPEIFTLREQLRSWRFYDHFRSDSQAPARQPQLGTRTPVLDHDGRDFAAALQTIREIGDSSALDHAVDDAFPGARVGINAQAGGNFEVEFYQHGLLRPLKGAELSDGTLRYLLWVAALLTPRPPALMVLNEPETSLHPDLLPAFSRLIEQVSRHSQVWVVSHASRLINALQESDNCNTIKLQKETGQTTIDGLDFLSEPAWSW